MSREKDRIILQEMSFYGYHGVLPAEKTLGQFFLVSLELCLDLRRAGEQDDLEATVDYAAVYETVKAVMEGPSRDLLEALAEEIAARLLCEPVEGVIVEIKKPAPPLPVPLSYAAVRIQRGEVR